MSLYSDIQRDRDPGRVCVRHQAYRAYLSAISEYLPPETKDFALADWYYKDFDKCPHDAWLEKIEIVELASGSRKEDREIQIGLILLAASHRGHIHFKYSGVTGYELATAYALNPKAKHDDWLSDQLTLGGVGELEHEIIFSSGTVWKIRCRTIAYEYRPIEE